jgi:hypothetical protein|uniref:Uncharacterized protein n=1 Tax=viral metagenome TaxID=1070528 RepID=A0A6H1ZAZ8_9ZZZZ
MMKFVDGLMVLALAVALAPVVLVSLLCGAIRRLDLRLVYGGDALARDRAQYKQLA